MENTINIHLIILTLAILPFACKAQDGAVDLENYNFKQDLNDKRSHLYSFGLGKRNNEISDNWQEYEDYRFNNEDPTSEMDFYHDVFVRPTEKRQATNFYGPGKRIHRYDFGLGKRGGLYKYDFGLGKRGANTKYYQKYDGPRPSLGLNFGLGKRSPNSYSSKNF